MSKKYRDMIGVQPKKNGRTSEQMRQWCQRPGKRDEHGKIMYKTQQHHKEQCDVNKIVQKYDRTGLIQHVSRMEAKFGDATGIQYKEAMDLIINAQRGFDQLPSKIRKYFDNDPGKFVAFMEDERNRDEAIRLGLIDKMWTDETDGLGEHVLEGKNVKKSDEEVSAKSG